MTPEEYVKFDTFLNETLFDVKETLYTEERYNYVFNLLYNYLKAGFEDPNVRKHMLNYTFDSQKIYKMEIRHFVVNLLCWYPILKLDVVDDLSKKFVYNCTNINKNNLMEYFNTMILEPYRHLASSSELNEIFSETIYRLGQISLDFNEILSVSISIQTFMDIEEQSEEFASLIRTEIPVLQPKEIETYLNRKTKKLVKIFKETKNDLRPIIVSNAGIRDKQLCELLIAGGLKPDMVGNTIPIPIDSNFLTRGLDSVKNFYIDKQAGRKAVVVNKTMMGEAGHFASKIMKITKDTRLDFKTFDCKTRYPVRYYVKTKDHLKIINRSFYKLDENDTWKVIDSKKDIDLIGKSILLRVPTTCGCGNNHVCLMCYGEMYKVNDDPVFGHGSYSSAISANKYQQDTLSTKHLQTTNSVPIEFDEIFYDVFTLDSGIISVNPENIEDVERWKIIIETDNKMLDFDQGDFNSYTDVILLYDKKTDTEYQLREKSGNDIYLYQDIVNDFNDRIEIEVSELEEELPIGVIIVENNELTKPLKNMQKLLDTKDHLGCNTISDLVNKAADLIIEADMNVLLVHICMTLKNLIRLENNIYEYPKFSSLKKQNYTILRITEALVNNPSLTTGLASQNLRSQLSNPITYQKTAKASSDVFFKKTLV